MNFDFQRLQDDFQGLNFNDPGSWPLAPRLVAYAALFLGALVLGWLLDWSDQWASLEQSQAQEQQLREVWLSKKRQAVNLDEYRRQLSEINRQLETLVRQLPVRDNITEFYAAVPVKISVTGSYNDLGEFASDVARMPRIVTIKSMVLTAVPPQGGSNKAARPGGRLKLDATVETYRYLEQDELAKQGGKK